MGFGFDGVNEIGKLDGILNEKYRHVISHQIKVTLFRIKFGSKATHVAHSIG